MSDRSEASIIVLVLASAAAVLAAPVIGRLGAPVLADVAMWTAAVCGVSAFGVAAASTINAARRANPTRGTEGSEQ